MAEDIKTCQCAAVGMLVRIPTLMLQWLDDMPGTEPALFQLMNEMSAHLNSQLSRPQYQGVKKDLQHELVLIEERMAEAVAEHHNTRGVEVLRDAIHRFAPIREAFLCGPALPVENPHPGHDTKKYTVDGETNLSRRVFAAMHVFGDDADKAKADLEAIYQDLSCGS